MDTDVFLLKDPTVVLEQNDSAFTVCQTHWNPPGTFPAIEYESVINAITLSYQHPTHPTLSCAIGESLANTWNALKAKEHRHRAYDVDPVCQRKQPGHAHSGHFCLVRAVTGVHRITRTVCRGTGRIQNTSVDIFIVVILELA
jgi:hypothetical protein